EGVLGFALNSNDTTRTSLLAQALPAALARRRALIAGGTTQAFRAFSAASDGIDGIFIDILGPGAVLMVYEGTSPRTFDAPAEAAAALHILSPLGVRAVYLKPFAKDRSRLGGALPKVVTDPTPAAGDVLPESILIKELDWTLEVRLYD